jgi:light-regulated signal transduction histidine kinase (bacteriophytochrome)
MQSKRQYSSLDGSAPSSHEHLLDNASHPSPTADGSSRPTSPRHRAIIQSPYGSDVHTNALSPGSTDRVYPIRSAVHVDPNSTPAIQTNPTDSYFYNVGRTPQRNSSISASESSVGSRKQHAESPFLERTSTRDQSGNSRNNLPRLPAQLFQDVLGGRSLDGESTPTPQASMTGSVSRSTRSGLSDDAGTFVTTRFQHVITEDGHAVITGRDGEVLQRCEDEPIHIPGAIQGFGLLVAIEDVDGKLVVRVVSENSKRIIGYSPKQLFALESFTDIMSDEQADNLLDHIDFIRDDEADVSTSGPEVFTLSIRSPKRRSIKMWCAIHINERNSDLIICEFELEDDVENPLVPPNDLTPQLPEDTLNSVPTDEEFAESTHNTSRPLRVLRSARKRRGEAAAMEVFNIMSQVQEQLASAPTLEKFLKVLVGVIKELTGFHRVMIYQFDAQWNGRVVTELLDPRATKDLYKGLNFPASDIPKQARDLYKINKVRLLYDRDQETARLVCRTPEDLETPLDLTYSYLRAMSPIHLKYLENMAVRSSMSVSINAFDELWGLISCHGYGTRGTRVAFPIRKMCRLVGDTASRNIERLSYASRLQARKLINTVPTPHNPSGYIIASSEDLLKLFNADFGLLSIREETKFLGHLEHSQEALAMLEYLRMRKITSVTASLDIINDFPDLRYAPGFQVLAGLLLVPLSSRGQDFIVFFRKGQLKEVKWAGNPYEKFVKEGTEGYLEPRKSFKTWSETVVGRCREWTEEEVETAAVLCLVYGKFIDVWRQKEAALQNSQLTRLLLANSAHEVRTPLNAIINYLEIALEGTLDQETRDNLAKSHSASKSLIYVINDLLDLTKTEEGGDLIKGDIFNLKDTLKEATDAFKGDAKRKNIMYEVIEHPGLPTHVLGDQRKVRQATSNIVANAIQHTSHGGVKVEMRVAEVEGSKADIEIIVEDTGIGMTAKQLDSLFRDLEQVQSEPSDFFGQHEESDAKLVKTSEKSKRTLGLGLAVVARIIRNMNGQLRLKSEEGTGSRFVVVLPFDLPEGEYREPSLDVPAVGGPSTPGSDLKTPDGEVTLVARGPSRAGSFSSSGSLAKKESLASLNSQKSMKSFGSGASQHSGRSDVDRLIEAIQEPPLSDLKRRSGERPTSARSANRPILDKRRSYDSNVSGITGSPPSRNYASSLGPLGPSAVTLSESERSLGSADGQPNLTYSSTPVKAVKIPGETGTPIIPRSLRETKPGTVTELEHPPADDEPLDAKVLQVLVAEDDPVNSRIVKKRMEKLGHIVHLTVNGEECANAYSDHCEKYDVVLMDMQVSSA